MSIIERYRRPLAIGGVTILAAAGGIGGALAAPSGKTTTSKAKSSQSSTTSTDAAKSPRDHRRGPHGPGLHAEAVVLNEAGDKFITVTTDMGDVTAVVGNTLTLKQAFATVVYKANVDIAVDANADVMRNGKTAKLSDIKVGDKVFIAASSDGTRVMAGDAEFGPRPGGRGHHEGREGRGHDEGREGRGPVGPPMMG